MQSNYQSYDTTWKKTAERYWWERLYLDAKEVYRQYKKYQIWKPNISADLIHPIFINYLWAKVHLDIIKMPVCRGKYFIIQAREHFSGWVEAKTITKNNLKTVTKFIYEDIFCRHDIFGLITVDGGPENKKEVAELLRLYDIKRVQISAYNPLTNGLIEYGYKIIINVLSKLIKGGCGN